MLTIAIPQLYCGASGRKGAYNRQEVGLARAFAALGCRALAVYPDTSLVAPEAEDLEPNVRVLYLPARALSVHAFYKSWQPLLDEGVDAVHVMGDNSLGVPGLYRFCRKHGIFFYSQLGALKSDSRTPAVRLVMDLLLRRNLAVYRRTPTYAKTPALAREMERLGVSCAGVMPVGLDTSIIPMIPGTPAEMRAELGLDPAARYLLFVGRLDPYKRPMALPPLMEQLGAEWHLIVIGQGSLAGELDAAMKPFGDRYTRIPKLPNTAVHAYYHACNVFVNLNDHEIFGMSLLEAMYAGCPPAARRAPGPELIIEDGVSGVLADSDAALPDAVRRAAADPEMGPAAQRRVNEHFLWGNSAETALAMLEKRGVPAHG